jgi:hypothetical protein
MFLLDRVFSFYPLDFQPILKKFDYYSVILSKKKIQYCFFENEIFDLTGDDCAEGLAVGGGVGGSIHVPI